MNRVASLIVAWIVVAVLSSGLAQSQGPTTSSSKVPPPRAKKIDFAQDVHPLLAAKCGRCHGAEKQEGGLRVDARTALLAGGDSGPVLTPGKGDESRLVRYVAGADPDYVMPPEGERLSAKEIALLRDWIDQGASGPDGDAAKSAIKQPGSDHWAFQPIKRPAPPPVKETGWVANPLDRFILARLERERIAPSPQADAAILCRRLYLDLIGIPPTPAEVDTFVSGFSGVARKDAKQAYSTLVEKLLASPHYGERWGRHWLDAARYADSDGYNFDGARSIWKYRDWVIGAFNRDLPFDQFTIEQIAGDLLPDATVEQKIATGFQRNTLLNLEGGNDPEEYRNERVVDRVNTLGSVFLGLTVGCAECHAHKYDPISQREYYQLFAFYNNGEEPSLELPTPEQVAQRETIRRHVAQLENKIKVYDHDSQSRFVEWEQRLQPWNDWTTLPAAAALASGDMLKPQTDHSLLASGNVQRQETYSVIAETAATNITGFRLEALPDPSLPAGGPGLQNDGTFILAEFSVSAAPHGKPVTAKPVAWRRAIADQAKKGSDIALAIDGQPATGWSVDKGPVAHVAVFETTEEIGFPEGTLLTFTLRHDVKSLASLGRFRLSAISAARPAVLVSPAIATVLGVSADNRSVAQQKLLMDEFHRQDPERQKRLEQIDALNKTLPKPVTTLVMQEKPTDRRPTHIHIRGSFLRKGDVVTPGVPSVLPPLPKNDATRLDLARWLVAPANPLTARVAVNRCWQIYFGQGLVETENDFGRQSTPPTHPELLDWLASEFMTPTWSPAGKVPAPWSMKSFHRLMVHSATYRQSSNVRPELATIDPRNLLLARQTRMRLEGEIIRDAALAVGGLLSSKMGGPSVFPYQPDGVMDQRRTRTAWAMSAGEDRYRRSVYTHFWRTSPHPFFITFDGPKADLSCTRRTRSNTPMQALMMLNEPPFVESARALARRVLEEPLSGDAERAAFAFRAALSRQPSAREIARVNELLAQQLQEFQADSPAAVELTAGPPPTGVTIEQFASWTATARVLLNVDEFMTRE